jgi:hypothetical protein
VTEKADFHERLFRRTQELQTEGLDWLKASSIAWLEERIRQWPAAWGDSLQVLIYGDFKPPEKGIDIPSLGIFIHPEKQEKTVIRTAHCVLRATVQIEEKSIEALIDASQRINVLLGGHTLVEWGNGACGWWSWVTHDTGGGTITKLDHKDLPLAIESIQKLPHNIRQKVDAALYWVREPKSTFLESHKSDLLRVYSAYWNAFECLVEAVNILRPPKKLTKSEKQKIIDQIVAKNSGKLTPALIDACYKSVINPGFVLKATHALEVCFEKEAVDYINECFRLAQKKDRLYEIRNSINHGNVDAENPHELIRISSRMSRLWMIVWRMFGRLISFPAPLDSKLNAT